jgi:hypothetical protein
MKRFQAFALDIQKAYAEALSRQADPLVAAPDQFARSPPGLVQSPNPRDIAAARLQVFAAFVESGVPWTTTWREFVQKSGDRRAAFARETVQELRNQSAADPAVIEVDGTSNEAV